jgi:hypothetical protein
LPSGDSTISAASLSGEQVKLPLIEESIFGKGYKHFGEEFWAYFKENMRCIM